MTHRVDSTHTKPKIVLDCARTIILFERSVSEVEKRKRNRRAFTLVELLVVIAIIGLLSTVAVVGLDSSRVNARNTKRKADPIQISKALELYYADHGTYPDTTGLGLLGFAGNCSDYGGYPNTDSPTSWIPGLVSGGYMSQLPIDPNSGKANPRSTAGHCQTTPTRNCYLYKSDGRNYAVFAYCTPEGAISSSDPFYVTGQPEYKLTDDRVATSDWY